MSTIENILRKYADALGPWAEATARRMLEEVSQQDFKSWQRITSTIGKDLQREILTAPTGEVMKNLLAEQVGLIKSIPLSAANRVHDLTLKGIEDSTRAKQIAVEILRSNEVAASRAMLIARTEVSRTAGALTQARAQFVGSDGYIWRTSRDGDVRRDHRELNGKFFRWDDPPIADKKAGRKSHPGCIYNCRCWAEVVLPE
jgi:SPP1 gp7 family putative phage head morphogenesis protein